MAKVTIEHKGIPRTWTISDKHLWALESFLNWAHNQDLLKKKRVEKNRRARVKRSR